MNPAGDKVADERKQIQDAFIRVCRDSGFRLEAIQAAALTSKTIGVHSLQVWIAMGSLDNMQRVASGEHPAATRQITPAENM